MGFKKFWDNLFNKEKNETDESFDQNKDSINEEPKEENLNEETETDKAEDEQSDTEDIFKETENDEVIKEEETKQESITEESDDQIQQQNIETDTTEKIDEDTQEIAKEPEIENIEDDKTAQDDIKDIENEETVESETVQETENDEVIKEESNDESSDDEEKSEEQEEKPQKKSFFARLKEGLKKTSNSFSEKFDNLFKGHLEIDDDLYDEIEEILITSDISFTTTLKIVDQLKENIKEKKIDDVNLVKPELKEVMYEILSQKDSKLNVKDGQQSVLIFVGVNGVGKTTSIGKIAHKLKSSGKSVLLAAGDTFRAAAKEQLEVWSKRADVDIVSHPNEGADPSAVIYDAIHKAKAKNIDVLICDTAGRLHNKKNLMNELEKIKRTVDREHPDANQEILLVIDATTGQNALNQVKTFNEVVNLTGVVLTKLDGTAKGGVILSIMDEYNIPVKFVGVGEKIDDLQEFNARDFVDALF